MKCLKMEYLSMEECEETCPLKCQTISDKIKCQVDPNQAAKDKEDSKKG